MTFPRARVFVCATLLTASILGALPAALGAEPIEVEAKTQFLSARGWNATQPVVDASDSGHVVAAWVEESRPTYRAMASRYSSGAGWSVPQEIYNASGNGVGLTLGVDAQGRALLVMFDYGVSQRSIWESHSPPGGPWTSPAKLNGTTAFSYRMGGMDVSPQGAATVFWAQFPEAPMSLWAATGNTTSGFGAAFEVSNASSIVESGGVAMGEAGSSTVVWCQSDGAEANLTWARHDAIYGWSAPTTILRGFSDFCGAVAVAEHPSGGAVAAVQDLRTPDNPISSLLYTPLSGWSAPAPLVSGADSDSRMVIKTDAAGKGYLAYRVENDSTGQTNYEIYGASFDAGGAAAAPSLLHVEASPSPIFGLAGLDEGGALAAVQPADNQQAAVALSRHLSGAGCSLWTSPMAALVGAQVREMALTTWGAGQAVLMAVEYDGAQDSLAAHFVGVPAPPSVAVTSPTLGAILYSSQATVVGRAWAGADVSAGASRTTADPNGSFALSVPALPGYNEVTVVAKHAGDAWAPCEASTVVSFTYDEHFTMLQDELDQALSDLNATRSSLAGAQQQLDLAIDTLNDTADKLGQVQIQFAWLAANQSAAEANASGFKGELTSLQADYDAAQARILLLEAQQNATAQLMRETADNNAALAGQVAVLSVVAVGALLGTFGSLGVALLQLKHGGANVASAPTAQGTSRVENPAPSSGGAEAESSGKARDETPQSLSRRDR